MDPITQESTTEDKSLVESTETKSGSAMATFGKVALAVAGIAAAAATFYKVIRPWHLTWGATDEEIDGVLPGDDLIPNASSITHAITIDAPLDCVWPWLAELGQNKGNVYKYSWLEKVIGEGDSPSGEHPTWQDLKIGDSLQIHTNYPPAPVVDIKNKKHMVLGLALGDEKAVTWSFVLHEFRSKDGEDSDPAVHTRFIVRFREPAKGGISKAIGIVATEPVQFVIERKMMLTIKKMAEELAQTKALEASKA
jgi:hypothetical protein